MSPAKLKLTVKRRAINHNSERALLVLSFRAALAVGSAAGEECIGGMRLVAYLSFTTYT